MEIDGNEYEGENLYGDDLPGQQEPDPGMVAFLDQEQAAMEEMKDEFTETFGFYHKCRCAEDYGAGRMVEVTECFAEMVGEALATCQQLNNENLAYRAMLEQLVREAVTKEIADVHDSEAGGNIADIQDDAEASE